MLNGKLFPTILSLIGLILSAYAVYVEHRVAHSSEEDEFVALCDIDSIGASCSRTFMLPQGKLLSYFRIVSEGNVLDVPNALLGLIHYTLVLFLENTSSCRNGVILLLVMIAFSTSVYLAYILTSMNELCILCWSTHFINAVLLIYYLHRIFRENEKIKYE